MLYMPVDLFGSYIQGREYAIDRNWNDMNQSNNVEQGWLNNDAKQLNNWFTEDTYGNNLSNSNAGARINQNKAIGSDLNTQLALTGQPGAVSAAQSLSDYQTALANASRQNIPTIAGNQATYQLGQSADNAARGNALLEYSPQIRPQQVQNELTTAQNNQQVLQASADLLPLQTEVGQQNLQAQQRALQAYQNGTLFPQQTVAGTTLPVNPTNPVQGGTGLLLGGNPPTAVNPLQQPVAVDPVAIYSVAGRLTPGQSTVVNGVPVSRDEVGLFILNNGTKQYVQPPQATPRQQSALFSFGGK